MNADRSFVLCHVLNVVLVEISKLEPLEGQSEWGTYLGPPKLREGWIHEVYVYMALCKISSSFPINLVVSRHCLCRVMWPTEDSHFVQGACAIYAMQLLFRNVAMSKYTGVFSFLVDALPHFWCRPALLPKRISGSRFEASRIFFFAHIIFCNSWSPAKFSP
jgi:hypothetical protein